MPTERFGFELPLLLGGAFRAIVDELHVELSRRGHSEARPLHGFALQAVGPDGVSITELGRRLGVTKQAATKTAAGLERRGYATRGPDLADGRATRVQRTARGEELLAISADVFEMLHARWAHRLGAERLQTLERDLEHIAADGEGTGIGDLPGWLR